MSLLSPYNTQNYQSVPNALEDPAPSSEFEEKARTNVVRLRSDRRRVGWIILLPTLLLMLVSAGLATFLILWLTVIRGVPGSDGLSAYIRSTSAFTVNEGTTATPDGEAEARLLGLTITTITTSVVSVSAPFLVTLAAYCFAGTWLTSHEEAGKTRVTLPTPLQYGLLVKLLGASGIMSLWQAGRYLLRPRNRRVVSPSYLTSAFILTATIFTMTHLISLADLWLHSTSFATLRNASLPLPQALPLGVTFNETLCINSELPVRSCLVEGDGWAISHPNVSTKGMLIATNSSTSADREINSTALSVVTLADSADLAILVPAQPDPSITFEAPSFGIRSHCSNLTPKCLMDQTAKFNCSPAGYPQLPFNSSTVGGNIASNDVLGSRVLSLVNGTLVGQRFGAWDTPGMQFPSNPQTVLLQLVWSLNQDDLGTFKPPNSVISEVGDGQLRAWTACDMSFFNVTIRHSGGRFGVVGEPLRTMATFTGTMWAPLLYQIVTLQLLSNLEARTMTVANDDSLLAAINQELSRLTLGAFGGALISAPTISQSKIDSTLIGRYPVAPVVAYVVLLYLYSLITLGVFIWATSISSPLVEVLPDGKAITTLEVAQLHLTDPLTLVANLFPSHVKSAARRSIQSDPVNMFEEDETSPRLQVGVDTSSSTNTVFGVYGPEVRRRKARSTDESIAYT